MNKIVSAKPSGGSYWRVELQDVKTGSIYQTDMHETEYKLMAYEESILGKVVTQEIIDDLKDLQHDVEHHNQCMDEND